MVSEEPIRKFLYAGVWINPDAVNGVRPLVDLEAAFSLYIEDGELKVDIINGGTETVSSGLTVSASSWQFISFQFNEGIVYVAVDDLVYKTTVTLETMAGYDTTLTVGSDGTNYFDGKIEELVLDANAQLIDDIPVMSDIPSQYDAIYWTFSENTGSYVYPTDLIGPTLTLTGGAWVTGYTRYAVQFDGTDDYGSATPTAETFSECISVNVMVKFDVDAACPIISQSSGINLEYTGTHIRANINGVTEGDTDIAPLTIDTDEWYDICVVFDGSVKSAWINGQKYGEVSATGTAVMPANTMYLARNVAGDSFGACRIATVRIYRRLLKPYYRSIDKFSIGQHGFRVTEEWIVK